MNNKFKIILLILITSITFAKAQSASQVGLYRVFERSIENNNSYTNKFTDVDLTCTYTSPSGKTINFYGFFDGDGIGGGDLQTGNVWKIRFLPEETGEWKYKWEWSDSTPGGEGTFMCDSINAGKGVLRPYEKNPYWFAYNGNEPVWLKSYYESGHGSIAQPLDWLVENVYQVLIDEGYNHFQVNWMLPLCCFSQYYTDGPKQSITDLTLYQSGKASSTMRFEVWKMMEENVSWLNDQNVGLFMFLGFNGGRNGGPDWTKLNETEKDFYVKYVVARLAPYANIAGWNYVWEVEGDTENGELGCMRLVQKYDVFNHLRTYQDEKPKYNEFNRPEYNFAGVENHRIHSDDREPEYWAAPWTHHVACLMGYVPGKPVYMVEGNALWRRYWADKIKKETGKTPTLDEVRQSAWACATASASFTWCGHQQSGDLKAYGPQGLPFHGDENDYSSVALQIDILSDIMSNKIEFYKMKPSDELLSEHDPLAVWCMSEAKEQYLVFSTEGKPFKLKLSAGEYANNQWVSSMTGAGKEIPAFSASENEMVSFTPPDTIIDWVLIVRRDGKQDIQEEANFISSKVDSTGTKIQVTCSKEISIPEAYKYGFVIKEKESANLIGFDVVTSDLSDDNNFIIDLNSLIVNDQEIVMSYLGTLTATDGTILAPVKEMDVENSSTLNSAQCISAKTDTTGTLLFVNCDKGIVIPANARLGFTVKQKNGTKTYSVKGIVSDPSDMNNVIIELSTAIPYDKELVLTYTSEKGNYTATDGTMLASIIEMDIENNSKNGMVGLHRLQIPECLVYPNPFTEQVEISCDEIMKSVQIIGVSGACVYKNYNLDQSNILLNLTGISSGMYFVTITTRNATVVKNIVKL